jgi:hypothetical protein
VENEHRTYGLAEWAAALRVRRTEEELALAAATREREAARRNSSQEPASAKAARSGSERTSGPTAGA